MRRRSGLAELSPNYRQIAEIGSSAITLSEWWSKIHKFNRVKETRSWATVAVYVIWNIWKERNRWQVGHSCSAVLARDKFNLFFIARKD